VCVAQWVAFQFTEGVAGNLVRRSDLHAIIRAGFLTRRLLNEGLLNNFEAAVQNVQVREPAEYSHLIGRPDIPSLVHLCTAYVVSVAMRRFSYALNVGLQPANPIFRYHWIGNPVIKGDSLPNAIRETELRAVTRFNWGSLLRTIIDAERDTKPLAPSKLKEVLIGLREKAFGFQREYERLPSLETNQPSRLTDRQALVVETLSALGIAPRFRKDLRTEALVKWLRSLAGENLARKFVVELVTANLQPMWIRQKEAQLRIAFRRDTFWDVFEKPGDRFDA
jgi:hypothetical protein